MDNNVEMNTSVETTPSETVNESQSAETATVKKSFPVWIVALCAAVAVIVVAIIALVPKYRDYTITVVDEIGNPISNVMLTITDSKGESKTRITDAQGMVCFPEVRVGVNTVTVEQGLSEITILENTYTLDKKTSTLRVLVRDSKKTVDIYGNVKNDSVAYNVSTGSYNLPTTAGNTTYVVFNAYQTGIYKVSFVSDDPDMTVGHYGIPMYVQTSHCGDLNYDGKSFELTIQDTGTPYVIGVNCVNTADSLLTIERIGDAPFDPHYLEWTRVDASAEYLKEFSLAGKTLVDFDINSRNFGVYLAEDGYYYTNTGKLVYIRITTAPIHGSYNEELQFVPVINGSLALIAGFVDEMVGMNIGGYVYDDNGAFVGKYSYNDMIKAYMDYADNSYGVVPLTDELAECIQLHGNANGWFDPNDPGYIFGDIPVNGENAWLFLCMIEQ